MTIGKDYIANDDGGHHMLGSVRDRFAPDAIDAAYQEVTKFLNFNRAGQTMDVRPMEFDVLRNKAEA